MPPVKASGRTEHQEGIAGRAERAVQQEKDQQEAAGHHDHEPLAGRDEIFELAAPGDPIAGRELHLLDDLVLGLGDKRGDVAPPHVRRHDNSPLSVLARDLIGAFAQCEDGNLLERDGCGPRPAIRLRQRDRKVLQGFDVCAQRIRKPQGDLKAPVAFENHACPSAADRGADQFLDDRKAQAPSRDLGLAPPHVVPSRR